MPAWSFRELVLEDAPELQALFESCADYFEVVQGAPPGPTEAQREFTALPPGARYEEKSSLGVVDVDDTLIGFVDVVHAWPDETTVMLGLLLLEPVARRFGIGKQVLDGLVGTWRAEGFERVRIAVAGGNASALRFWTREGFVETERKPRPEMAGGEAIVMVREIG